MINIAELLKDAPKGMKLYSPLFGEVQFDEVNKVGCIEVIVTCDDGTWGIERFHPDGTYRAIYPDAECLLFPRKDYRTWQGWTAPVEPKFKVGDWIACDDDSFTLSIKSVKDGNYYFHQCASLPIKDIDEHYHLWSMADAKDGDILHHSCTASNGTFIFKGVNESGKIFCYCDYDSEDHFCLGEYHYIPHSPESKFLHPATKEQRDLLFAKMKEAGYEWDTDKTGLRKIQPHYDIANFKPFDKVLGRNCCRSGVWRADLFSHIHKNGKLFVGIGFTWEQCIPFNDDTKHLLGTTNPCDEQYINW